jgi:AcrR family transcriptional regulator
MNSMPRSYRLGMRQASVERTTQSVLAAARRLLAQAPASEVSVGAIAREAGTSRLTIYQRFGSRSGLFAALLPARTPREDVETGHPLEALRAHLLRMCEAWASEAVLYRHIEASVPAQPDTERRLAERLLAADALRPGCSIREAEDVIAALGSFAVFDRLHRDGRRTAVAVSDILMRLAAGILHPTKSSIS